MVGARRNSVVLRRRGAWLSVDCLVFLLLCFDRCSGIRSFNHALRLLGVIRVRSRVVLLGLLMLGFLHVVLAFVIVFAAFALVLEIVRRIV